MTLKGEEVLAVMFLEGVGPAGGGTDTQLCRNVFPGFVFGALKKPASVFSVDIEPIEV
jgi:hypothetical protein